MHKLLLFGCFLLTLFAAAQQQKEISIDEAVKEKTNDFNAVFVPLYNVKDTLKYNELLHKSRAASYITGEIIALNLLGTYYRDQSKYRKSVELHLEALELSDKHNNIDGIMYSNNMLGVVYRRMDDVEKGLEYHFKALKLAEGLKDKTDFSTRNTAIAVNGIGNSYLIMQEWESARKQFRRSLDIEGSIENRLGLAINYQNIGITYEEMRQPDSALMYLSLIHI